MLWDQTGRICLDGPCIYFSIQYFLLMCPAVCNSSVFNMFAITMVIYINNIILKQQQKIITKACMRLSIKYVTLEEGEGSEKV